MTMTLEQMIERVAALKHRGCDRCDDCRALKQVVALAREALAMKAARRRSPRLPPRLSSLYIAPGVLEKMRLRDVPETLGDPLE